MKLLRILAWLFVPFIMIFVSWKKLGKVAKIGGAIWAGFILLIIVIPTEEKPNVTATVETDAVASQEKAPKVEKAVAVVDTKTEKKMIKRLKKRLS